MDTLLPPPPSSTATFAFVVLPGFAPTTLAAAVEVLVAVNEILGSATYAAVTLSPTGGPVATLGGLALASTALADAPPLAAVFVVAATPPRDGDAAAAPLSAWLQARAAEGALMGGLDAGAACLAEAGLLRGHRAAIHWPHVAALAERHVDIVVSHHCYEIDRGRLSAAGHLASQDLLIAWFGLRHGDRVAQELVGALGLERLRASDERQRVPTSARLGGGSAKLAEAVALMEANLGEPLATEDIARLVGVSRRQLERLFKQHLDALPSRWYMELRLNRARRLLQHTSQSILQIGLSCGFASGPHFSNAYRAHFNHTPRDERSRRAEAWRTAPVNTPQTTP